MDEITLSQFEDKEENDKGFDYKDLIVTIIFVGGIVFFGIGAALWGYSTSGFHRCYVNYFLAGYHCTAFERFYGDGLLF